MSKSLKNYIGITEPPEDIYGKVMSIPDSLITSYLELLTDTPGSDLEEIKESLEHNTVNPMEIKKMLAKDIVTQLYDKKVAEKAADYFLRVVQKKEIPQAIPEFYLKFSDFYQDNGRYDISRILVSGGLVKSRSQALRLIKEGAVSIDDAKLIGPLASLTSGSVIKVGKLRFAKIINKESEGEENE
jgi:tyrosyl-tRNA synthetase